MKARFLTTSVAAALAVSLGTSAVGETVVRLVRPAPEAGSAEHYAEIEAEYEAANPDIDVQFEYIANEAYKQKLTTLLQSKSRPDIFYSWGGGVLKDQFDAGFTMDITDKVKDTWAKNYGAAGINAFTLDDQIIGAPINALGVVFWVNLELAEQVGIDIATIETWDDFLEAVAKAKDAGLNPITVGGKDKWPLHFYYSYLAVRAAGAEGFAKAMANEGDGFAAPEFVRAGEEFKRLVDLDPFQKGFISMTYEQSTGRFGDGEAVFWLMGDWGQGMQAVSAQDGMGIPDEKLAIMPFPVLEGGKGKPTDTFGGINGWVVANGASDEAVEFLKYLNSPESQSRQAAAGTFIPTAIGASDALTNPYMKQIGEYLAASEFHQLFLDQALGADVGATFNDLSADLAQGVISPEEAANMLKEAWEFQ